MLIKELCELQGVSGNEKDVRDYILERISAKVDSYKIDKIGNLIAQKKGLTVGLPQVIIAAHMDEVGLLITEITGEGFLKFQPIGGIDSKVLVSKTVSCGAGSVPGVIGAKAIHLQKPEERKQPLRIEELYIDIGASAKEEAQKAVKIGDYVSFVTDFEPLGSELYKAKGLDDRAGCAVIMEILEDQYPCDLIAAFTVQEEVGLRGSKVISNYLEADLALIIEATRAADFKENNKEDYVVEVGKGPACSLMDSATVYKPELIQKVKGIASKHQIPFQYRQGTAAANDAGNIHQACKGIPVITLSIPCRNIHSPCSLLSPKDLANCLKLVKAILAEINIFLEKPEKIGGTNG